MSTTTEAAPATGGGQAPAAPAHVAPDHISVPQWIAVGGAVLCSFLSVLNHQITNTSLREIQGSLSATLTEASWITTSYLASSIVIMPLTAWLARAFGVRAYAIGNTLLFLLSLMACALAVDLNSMIALRFISGFFGGGLVPLSLLIILSILPPSRRPVAFMFWGMMTTQAASIGPTLGGWLTDLFSWELIFYVQLIPCLIISTAFFIGLERSASNLSLLRQGQWFSIVCMAIGLFLLITVLEEGNRNDWFDSDFIVRTALVSAALLSVFVLIQLTARDPYINLRLFGRRNFAISCFIHGVAGLGFFGTMFTMALFLAQIPQYTATQIGTVIMWVGLPQLVAAPMVLWLMHRVDYRYLVAFGCFLFSFSCFFNVDMTHDTGYWDLSLVNIMRSIGQPFIMVVLPGIATAGIEAANHGSASAVFNLSRDLVGAMGLAGLKTGLVRRTDFHVNHVTEHVTVYDGDTVSRLDALTQKFLDATGDPDLAARQALWLVDRAVHREGLIMAYNDMFYAIGVAFALATLACLLFRKPQSAPPPATPGKKSG
jgi:DHA2 family multidrug resistance protein